MRMIRICFGLILLLAASGRMLGQAGATGSILGTITDGAGAILPNVQVTVTNTATGSAFQTVTSSAGDYLAPALSPGTYSVSAQAQGFKKSVTTWFTLTVDQVVRVDLRLKPGAATETEAAMARAVALDTDSAALSQLVSRQQVEELPLNGRNFMQLLLVGAGAVTVGGEQGTLRQGEGDAVSVNGGRPEGNNYTLDGLVNTDPALVTPAVVLSQDAIQEFKVESGTYPAEYGFSASQVNIVSKSGSNEFHGALFESNRNDAFDALPFATVLNLNSGVATTNPILRQNQFGFVMDGPVEIPKLYNGRGKTFWMANYEGWRINNGSIAYETVPNPAVLSGDVCAGRGRAAGRPVAGLWDIGLRDAAGQRLQLHAGGSNNGTGIPKQSDTIDRIHEPDRASRGGEQILGDADAGQPAGRHYQPDQTGPRAIDHQPTDLPRRPGAGETGDNLLPHYLREPH